MTKSNIWNDFYAVARGRGRSHLRAAAYADARLAMLCSGGR